MTDGADAQSLIAELSALLADRMAPQAEPGSRAVIDAVKNVLAEVDRAREASAQANQRLDDLLGVIVALVSFDYSKKAEVTGADDVLDGVAFGLNMLSQELSQTTVSKKYVKNIIESMADLLVVTDAAGIMKTVNRAAGMLSGYSPQELIGQSIHPLFPETDISALIEQGGVKDHECECLRKDGSRVSVSLTASIMRHPRGKLEGVVCVARDLTEGKRQAEERWRLRESIQRQAILLDELSTPLIPITRKVLVMPLVGSLDSARAAQMTEALLHGVAASSAEVAIVDITGLRGVDAQAVSGILRAVRAMRLIGAKVVLTGIRQDVARALVAMGSNLTGTPTFGTLERGILFALQHHGPAGP